MIIAIERPLRPELPHMCVWYAVVFLFTVRYHFDPLVVQSQKLSNLTLSPPKLVLRFPAWEVPLNRGRAKKSGQLLTALDPPFRTHRDPLVGVLGSMEDRKGGGLMTGFVVLLALHHLCMR